MAGAPVSPRGSPPRLPDVRLVRPMIAKKNREVADAV